MTMASVFDADELRVGRALAYAQHAAWLRPLRLVMPEIQWTSVTTRRDLRDVLEHGAMRLALVDVEASEDVFATLRDDFVFTACIDSGNAERAKHLLHVNAAQRVLVPPLSKRMMQGLLSRADDYLTMTPIAQFVAFSRDRLLIERLRDLIEPRYRVVACGVVDELARILRHSTPSAVLADLRYPPRELENVRSLLRSVTHAPRLIGLRHERNLLIDSRVLAQGIVQRIVGIDSLVPLMESAAFS